MRIKYEYRLVEGARYPSRSQRRQAMLGLERATWGKWGVSDGGLVGFDSSKSWAWEDRPEILDVSKVVAMSIRRLMGDNSMGDHNACVHVGEVDVDAKHGSEPSHVIRFSSIVRLSQCPSVQILLAAHEQ